MKVTPPPSIVLMACGSFSPPTPMHLRMFEIARDHFHQLGSGCVVGGIVSPTHDAYGKKDLISSTHRIPMLKLAVQSSDWIKVSEWECQQENWTRTRPSMQYHQNCVNTFIKESINGNLNKVTTQPWFPEALSHCTTNVQLKLLCGADLLESFSIPGLWHDEDIEAIVGQHGIVVVSRSGSNPEQFIFNSDILSKYRRNITLVTNWVANDVSSTLVRRLFSRNLSVKYLLDDVIIDYVKRNGLYGSNETIKYTDSNPLKREDFINANNVVVKQPHETVFSASDDDEDYEQAHTDDNFVQAHIEITNKQPSFERMDETDGLMSTSHKLDPGFSAPATYKVFCCGEGYSPRSPLINRPGGAVKVITKVTPAPDEPSINKDEHNGRKVSLSDEKSMGKLSQPGDSGDGTSLSAPGQSNLHHKLKDKKNICNLSLSAPSTSTHVNDTRATGRVSPSKSYDELIEFVFTEHGIKVISDKEYEV